MPRQARQTHLHIANPATLVCNPLFFGGPCGNRIYNALLRKDRNEIHTTESTPRMAVTEVAVLVEHQKSDGESSGGVWNCLQDVYIVDQDSKAET